MTESAARPETEAQAPAEQVWPELGSVAGSTPRPEPWAGWDIVIRVSGVVVSLLATVFTAVFEMELSALRIGAFQEVFRGDSPYEGVGAPLPLAVLLAIGANLAISWFAVTTTARRWAIGPPWALWTLLMLAAAGTRTTEGDYLIGQQNWVALVTILAGSLTFAIYSYRMILKPVPADSELSGSA